MVLSSIRKIEQRFLILAWQNFTPKLHAFYSSFILYFIFCPCSPRGLEWME